MEKLMLSNHGAVLEALRALSKQASADKQRHGRRGSLFEAHKQAEAKLRSTIQAAFRKFDADDNGMVDISELGRALGELSGGDGSNLTLSIVSEAMNKYDSDGNGALDVDEFSKLVTDMAADGRLTLTDELQQECRRIAALEADHPWATALRGDAQVRSMMRELRKEQRSSDTGRRSGMLRAMHSRYASRECMETPKCPLETVSKDVMAASGAHAGRRCDVLDVTDALQRRTSSSDCGDISAEPSAHVSASARACQLCCARVPVLSPDGRFRTFWNVLMALLIVYCGFVVPLGEMLAHAAACVRRVRGAHA
jgi:hypothetical protein